MLRLLLQLVIFVSVFIIIPSSIVIPSVNATVLDQMMTEESESIHDNKKLLRIGLLGQTRPAYHEYDAVGNLFGIDIEYLINIAQKLNVLVEFEPFNTSELAYSALKNNEIDLVLDTQAFYKNQTGVSISKPIYRNGLAFWFKNPNNVNASPKTLRWSCITDSAFCNRLDKIGVEKVDTVNNLSEGIELVETGVVDGYIDFYPAISKYLDDYDIREGKIKMAHWQKNKAAVAVSTIENKVIIERVNSVLSNTNNYDMNDSLTPTNLYYLNDKKLFDYRRINKDRAYIRYSMDENTYPVFYRDSNGSLAGYVHDYIKLLESRSGLVFRYVPSNGKSVSLMMKNGEIDLIPIVQAVEDLNKDILLTEPYVQFNYVYVTLSGSKNTLFLNESNQKIGVLVPMSELLNDENDREVDDNTLVYPDIKALLTDLDSRKIAAAYMNEGIANTLIIRNEEDKYRLVIDDEHPRRYTKASFGITKDKPLLAEVLNGVMKTVNKHEFDQIIANYQKFNVVYGYEKKQVEIFGFIGVVLTFVIFFGFYQRYKNLKLQISFKEQEVELLAASQIAQDAVEARSRFLASMSHELRTPIAGTIGLIELLKDHVVTKEGVLLLDSINTSCNNLNMLVNDILDFSKIDANELYLDVGKTDITKIIGETLRLHNVTANEKHLDFVVTWEPSRIQFVDIDSLRFSQIINNLLSNAIKFTSSGEITTHIKISNSHLYLTITDTGIGMTPEQLEKMFKPFVQADESIARRFGGTGLGLSIVKNLLHMMDGVITYESKSGVGTKVNLTLPISNVENYEDHSLSDNITMDVTDKNILAWLKNWDINDGDSDSKEIIIIDDNCSMKCISKKCVNIRLRNSEFKRVLNEEHIEIGIAPFYPDVLYQSLIDLTGSNMHENRVIREKTECNVLAAEDNPINRLLIEKQLTELNVTFEIVNDGQEAFNKLSMNPQKYDVVLTDYHMPVMDGVTLAKKIRGQKNRFSNIKIIVVTAEQSQEVEGYMLNGIFDDALYKPYKIVDLLEVLKSEPITLEKSNQSEGVHWFHLFPIEESRFMAKIFIKTMVDDSNVLQETIKTDMGQLGTVLHRIKGGADAIGAKEIAEIARSAEIAFNESHDEKFILASVNELLNTMGAQIDITQNWLNNEL